MLQDEIAKLSMNKVEIVGKLSCQRDSYMKQLKTVVVSCEPRDDRFGIILQDTVLFPTGGGQPSDSGRLELGNETVKVLNVERVGLYAVHYTNSPITPGETITVFLDWDRRFDHMQQHSGQHLLSDIAEKIFSWKTFGWKLGEKTLSSFVEFEGVIPTQKQLDQLELSVNEFIQEAVPMELIEKELNDESRTEKIPEDIKDGVIRQIKFGEFEGPCCGTHVKTTAQIGGVKILQFEKIRGGNSRVYFLCGSRIQKHMALTMKINQDLQKILSCGPEDFADRISKKLVQLKTLLKENKKLKQQENKDAGALCDQFGISGLKSTTKPVILRAVKDHLENISNNPTPTEIVAIDVGFVNLAFCHLKVDFGDLTQPLVKIKDWGLLNPQMPNGYNVQQYSEQCRLLLDKGLFKKEAQLYLIERQSWRPMGFNRSVPQTIIKLSAFEAILMGTLLERGSALGIKAESISPGLISSHLKIRNTDSQLKPSKKYANKKTAGISIVNNWLELKHVDCPPSFRKMFDETPKKDDLCDSMMIGVGWVQMMANSKRFLQGSYSE